MVWNLELIQRLKSTDSRISRVVDLWIGNILEGFITKFTVDSTMSYNEAERIFFKVSQGKYLKSMKLWIKMLLCEKGVLRMLLDL